MDGVSGLEEGVKLIYPQTVVQRCIAHLIRNSVKYIPSKYLKDFCKDCKSFYGAVSLEACDKAFELFKDKWKDSYPGALKVWDNNFNYVRQLYSYPSVVRRIMYTTNAIESVNSILRKVTKKCLKIKMLYLRYFTYELLEN